MRANRLVLLLIIISACHSFAIDVFTINGDKFEGELLSVKDRILQIGTKKIFLGEVTHCLWQTYTSGTIKKGSFIFSLHNGDRLIGKITGADKESVTIESVSYGTIKIDLRILHHMFMSGSTEQETEYPSAGSKDRIFFVNGDSLEGVVKNISASGIIFESIVGKMHYDFKGLKRISLHALQGSEARISKAYFKIYSKWGEAVSGNEIKQSGDRITIHPFLLLPLEIAVPDVSSLEVMNGLMVFLSNLSPARVQEMPFWKNGFVWQYKRDRSIDGNMLTLKGRQYKKGLGVHSFCSLTYALDKKYKRFISDMGIDDEINTYGNVDVMVKGDGRVMFEKKGVGFDSETVTINIDISSVTMLELTIDFGDNFDIGDHADWAGAYLIKKR